MIHSYHEVFEQGESLKKTFEYMMHKKKEIIRFIKENEYEEIVFIACGSGFWLSMSACMTMQEKTGIPCTAVKSGEIVMNHKYYKKAYKKPLVIAPTRSGRTSETLMALQFMRKTYGSKALTVTENPNAPIMELCDYMLCIPWANEISVCQTKSFSNLYLACIMIASFMSADEVLLDGVEHYIMDFEQHRESAEQFLKTMIAEFPECKTLVALGSGKQYGVAVEGAYIAIEMAQFPSNYYTLLEFRHGPIVMADNTYLISILCGEADKKYEEKMAEEIKMKGAKVMCLLDEEPFKHIDYCFSLGRKAHAEVIALYGIMVMQGFAHLKAVDLGVDPDRPKELVPWISL